jgi:NADH:ubiquinone oxidoreductase subunit K
MPIFNQLQTYLYLALVLFAIGLYGVLARRNLIAMLISVELMLNAASINFMAFNRFLAPHPAVGQIITLFIMGVAAAEAAIALSIIIAVYRKLKTVNIDQATELMG